MEFYVLANPKFWWYARSRSLWNHLKQGSLSVLDNGFHDALSMLADPETGILWTNTTDIAHECGCSKPLAKLYVRRLEKKGYIKRFPVPRSKKHYPILVHGFKCMVGVHNGKMLDAAATKDWRVPVYVSSTQSAIQSAAQKARRSSSLEN